jgi:hypothetical protein
MPYYARMPHLFGFYPDPSDPQYQRDVTSALTEWIDLGIPSFCWDQFHHSNVLAPLIEKIRKIAQNKDPESTFSAEAPGYAVPGDFENDGSVIDYFWGHPLRIFDRSFDDDGPAPISSVVPLPRVDAYVGESPLSVKRAFAEGRYLKVLPHTPDQIFGNALIGDFPELSAALKKVAALRRQFLPFFADGTYLGDSVLSEPSGFVRGYQLGRKLFIIVLNDQPSAKQIIVPSDLDLWLPEASKFQVQYYDATGRLVRDTPVSGSHWLGITPPLAPGELAFFVIATE